jgi:hypothetical protein
MAIAATIDEYGKPAWIGLTILAFSLHWPLGLALLAFLLGSGRMGCWSHHRHWRSPMERMQAKAERWCGGRAQPTTSGNRAFDEYRTETLRRLEEEQRDFLAFLERLRHAKDKAEFDEFMAERRRRPPEPSQESQI